MATPTPRKITISKSQRITPSVQRIWFTGDDLSTFPSVSPGAYIKLMFDLQGNPATPASDLQHVAMRTYTVTSFDSNKQELSIDMVIHADNGITGPASAWATIAKPGDSIMIAGPGQSKPLSREYDWVLFAGDMTALPSIRNYLSSLPSNAKGFAVIAVADETDIVVCEKPVGVEIIWATEASLPAALDSLQWLSGTPAVWVACEFSDMRAIRKWLKDEKLVPHHQVYISSYWKKGRSEDQHKIDKRQDSDTYLKSLTA